MKSEFSISIAFLGLAALILTSCSEVPQVEIDAANAAIEQVEIAEADIYVPKSYIALKDSMKGVMSTIEMQKSKWFKNYSTVKEHLAGVTQFANEVKQQAETKIEEIKTEIQNTITDVKTLLEAGRKLLLEAPKGKEGTSALIAITDELNIVETSIEETRSMLEGGEYFATLDKVKAAKEKVTVINAELTEVINKYKANVKKKY